MQRPDLWKKTGDGLDMAVDGRSIRKSPASKAADMAVTL